MLDHFLQTTNRGWLAHDVIYTSSGFSHKLPNSRTCFHDLWTQIINNLGCTFGGVCVPYSHLPVKWELPHAIQALLFCSFDVFSALINSLSACWFNKLAHKSAEKLLWLCSLGFPFNASSSFLVDFQSSGAVWESRWTTVLGSPSLIVRAVSVDVKQHWRKICRFW